MQKLIAVLMLFISISTFANTIDLGNRQTETNMIYSDDLRLEVEFKLAQLNSFDVVYAPTDVIEYSDGINITSNDIAFPVIDLPVHGIGEGVGTNQDLIPSVTEMYGNYPNPFNPTTTISYGLNQDSEVSLFVFNIKGQKVKTLVRGNQKAGYHQVTKNGTDENNKKVTSGVYFYEFDTSNGEYTSIKKMLLLK
jgi:hypothetical protein